MGEIVLHGQKFKITGNEPTPQEQLAIDSYLDYREQSSGKTGNKELDDQAILTLKPEDVLSEANKGKYNKDTENFINSPSFKRIVLEVGLSIVGGVAGAALAPVTGGASLAASAALAARVARLARPLLNISANTVSRIGVGTAGGAVGGATGAALAQKFDPKEDIVITMSSLGSNFCAKAAPVAPPTAPPAVPTPILLTVFAEIFNNGLASLATLAAKAAEAAKEAPPVTGAKAAPATPPTIDKPTSRTILLKLGLFIKFSVSLLYLPLFASDKTSSGFNVKIAWSSNSLLPVFPDDCSL